MTPPIFSISSKNTSIYLSFPTLSDLARECQHKFNVEAAGLKHNLERILFEIQFKSNEFVKMEVRKKDMRNQTSKQQQNLVSTPS